jgi:hypothetical protein
MAISNNYTTDQLAQIDTLRSYVEEYCKSKNIDPGTYLASLDGNLVSADLRNDPVFQAYWQMAYLQLSEILDPSQINSMQSQVGEVDFDQLYAGSDQNYNDFISKLIQDNPEMMAFAAQMENKPEESESLLSIFNSSASAQKTVTGNSPMFLEISRDGSSTDTDPNTDDGTPHNTLYSADDARALGDKYNLGGGYDWLIGSEEGIRSTESSIFTYLAEMDQQLVDLKEGLRTGAMSAEEFNSDVSGISMYRETLLGMLQQLESSLSTIMDLYSKIIEKANEMQMATINNIKSA